MEGNYDFSLARTARNRDFAEIVLSLEKLTKTTTFSFLFSRNRDLLKFLNFEKSVKIDKNHKFFFSGPSQRRFR